MKENIWLTRPLVNGPNLRRRCLFYTIPPWLEHLSILLHLIYSMLHFLMLPHASLNYWLKVHLSALSMCERLCLYVSLSGTCLLHDCSSFLVYCCQWRPQTQPPPTHLHIKQGRSLSPCLSFCNPVSLSFLKHTEISFAVYEAYSQFKLFNKIIARIYSLVDVYLCQPVKFMSMSVQNHM